MEVFVGWCYLIYTCEKGPVIGDHRISFSKIVKIV